MNTMYDFAFSVQGYNHIKSDKVCQDSSGHYSDDSMAVVVVADGHGSDNYPRTDRGSSFAVEAAITAIREFVKTAEESAKTPPNMYGFIFSNSALSSNSQNSISVGTTINGIT